MRVRLINVTTPKEIDFIYAVRNHTDVRKFSFNQDPIPYEAHVDFWKKRLSSGEPSYVVVDEHGNMVGYVRLNKKAAGLFIDIAIHPDFQNRGYGKSAIAEVRKIHQGDALFAEVLENNEISKRLFESSGFTLKFLTYECGPTTQSSHTCSKNSK